MHEYKHGELKTRGSGRKVKNLKQAVATALHEAGVANHESPAAKTESAQNQDQGSKRRGGGGLLRKGKATRARTMKKATSVLIGK